MQVVIWKRLYERCDLGLEKGSRHYMLQTRSKLFALNKNQDYVVVGHQRTHHLVVYKRDKKTGKIMENTDEVMLFKPVCICFE